MTFFTGWRWLALSAALTTMGATGAAAQEVEGAPPATEAADAPLWIATLSTGLLDRSGDDAQPFVAAGLSRKLGRGYVRAAVTSYRGVTGETTQVQPSSFVLGSIGAGATFGGWFVDGYLTAGRQRYGDVDTPLGTERSSIAGSGTWGGGVDGGRYIALTRRLFLTPSVALQYNFDKVLIPGSNVGGTLGQKDAQRVLTGSGTIRFDRYFGKDDRHLIGISISRVQTTNGSSVLIGNAAAGGGLSTFDLRPAADGWFMGGSSASIRLSRRLWIDVGATRTVGARSGAYATATLGLRKAF